MESPYAESIDWKKWHVFWVDERVVPKDHADSNYKLAYDGFLSKVEEKDDSCGLRHVFCFALKFIFYFHIINLILWKRRKL